MIRTLDWLVKLGVWIIAIFIITGYFNPEAFFCGHSMSWRYFFTFCSIISLQEGMLAVVFIVLAINANLRNTTAYLVLIVLLQVAIEWMRSGEIISVIKSSYSWKILGIIMGFHVSRDWNNWKPYSVVLFFLFAAAYWQDEMDFNILKIFLSLTSFIFFAFLINRIRKSKRWLA